MQIVAPARSIAATRPIGGMGLKTNKTADAIAHRLAPMISQRRLSLGEVEQSATTVF